MKKIAGSEADENSRIRTRTEMARWWLLMMKAELKKIMLTVFKHNEVGF
jgi:hypothetical protein